MNMRRNHDGKRIQSHVDPLLYAQRLSYAKKKANDFEWGKQVADSIDFEAFPTNRTQEISHRLENYALWNGQGTKSLTVDMSEMANTKLFSDEEKGDVASAYTRIQHFDVISQIGHGMHGEQIARPLTVTVVDSSRFSQSEKRRVKEQLVQQHLNERIIEPMRQQMTAKFLQENGIEDPFQLAPEEQQAIQEQIEVQVQGMTPKDIKKYMSKEYKSTREVQANKLVQLLIKDLDIKFLTDENFKNAIIDGREIYYVGVRHGKPVLEIINPIYFRSYGSDDDLFIQDAERAVYERFITIADVYDKYSDQLKPADLKKLDNLLNVTGPGGAYNEIVEHAESRLIGSPQFNSLQKDLQGINPRTKEGQRRLGSIRRKYSGNRTGVNMVREAHIVWKSQRKLKHIKRVDEETGQINWFFIDESYTFNPLKGDVEEKVIWVNEVWECTKLGYLDGIYVNLRRVPYQYRSLDNPRNVKLPYIGAEYFKLFGNAEPTSPMQKGKSWNYEINLQMAKIREMEATDLGRVLLMTLNAKPDNWSWSKFFQVVRYTKMAPLDLKKEGIDQFDAQFFKSVDLSSLADVAKKIQYLEWLINRAAIAMSFNSARLGQTDQYSTVTNNQQNLARSLAQTASIYQMHDKIVNQVIESLLNASRVAYKDNPKYFANVLDDGEIAELELDPEILWSSEMGVHVTNSGDELDNLQMVKQNLMHFVQNGLGLPDSIKVMWSKSGAELYNVAQDIEDKQMQAQEQQMAAMRENAEAQKKMAEDMEVLKGNIKDMLNDKEWAAKLQMADINAETLRRANDVNANNINDNFERDVYSKELDMEKFNKEIEFMKEKFLKEMQLKEKELEIKEKQANKKK